jgi:hypothetical protein
LGDGGDDPYDRIVGTSLLCLIEQSVEDLADLPRRAYLSLEARQGLIEFAKALTEIMHRPSLTPYDDIARIDVPGTAGIATSSPAPSTQRPEGSQQASHP